MEGPLATPITSEDELREAIELSKTFLVVIDVHKKWCGPCEAMVPTFLTVKQKTSQADKRIALYSIELESFEENIQKILPEDSESVEGRGCKPMFLVFREEVCKVAVAGCNSPKLEIELFKLMPPAPEGGDEE